MQRDIATYDRFGDKLTGGPGNREALRWMEARLAALDYAVATPEFDQPSFAVERAELIVDGRVVEGFPLFPPRVTSPAGVAGPLVAWDGTAVDPRLAGAVALLVLPDRRHSSAALSFKGVDLGAAARAGARALVVVTRGPTGDLIALNADATSAMIILPTLLVAGRETAALVSAASPRASARVTLRVRQHRARPRNLVAIRRTGPRWIVVSTPVSGWFAAAAERGPGVATLLALAANLKRIAPCDSIALVATSGHEAGYGGIDALLAQNILPAPHDTRLWVHLGAGLAAWADDARTRPEPLRYLLTTASMADRAKAAFAHVDGYRSPVVVDRTTAVGEAETIIGHGYGDVVAGVSAHLFHHSRRDRADRTAGTLVAPIASAFGAMVQASSDQACRAD